MKITPKRLLLIGLLIIPTMILVIFAWLGEKCDYLLDRLYGWHV